MIKNLLVIDDDEINLFIVNQFIAKHQFAEHVINLRNGKEAIDYFEALVETRGTPPELIFLDLYMPIMTGWEFLDDYSCRFEPLFPATRICVLSNSLMMEDQLKAMSYTCCISFITKPLSAVRLISLKKYEALRQYF